MTIHDEMERAWSKAYKHIGLEPDEPGSFTEFISDQENNATLKAIFDLQPRLAIFELGIEWLSYLHVVLTNELESKSGDERYRATWTLVGAAVSYGLSIRRLCISGFDTPARALLRTYVEALLLCIAVLDDKQLAKDFVDSQTDEQVKNFWHSKVSPKNLHRRIVKIEKESGLPAEAIDEVVQWSATRIRNIVAILTPVFRGRCLNLPSAAFGRGRGRAGYRSLGYGVKAVT